MENKELTTVAMTSETKERLSELGKHGETYEEIIQKMISYIVKKGGRDILDNGTR